jgi:hypothetical protein
MYLVVILLMAGIIWVRAATPPDTISYQGYLTDASGTPVDTSVSMSVAFYDAATGGSNPYAEDHTNVTVSRGQFDLELGAGTTTVGTWGALDFSQALWMEITVGGETFTPRIPLSAVPYARYAFQSQQIGTLNAGNWCTSDGSVINCTQAAPVTAEDDPQVGSLTASKWCAANAGGTAIDCTQDAPSGGSITINRYSASISFTASAETEGYVACGSGSPIGGGYNVPATMQFETLASCPATNASTCATSSPTGWRVKAWSDGSVSGTIYVICAQ